MARGVLPLPAFSNGTVVPGCRNILHRKFDKMGGAGLEYARLKLRLADGGIAPERHAGPGQRPETEEEAHAALGLVQASHPNEGMALPCAERVDTYLCGSLHYAHEPGSGRFRRSEDKGRG